MANWNALMSAPNAGEAFVNAFTQGQQMRQQREMQARQLKQDDEDRQLRRDELQHRKALADLEQHRESIKVGAAILRQVQPKDQAGWDAALGMLQNYGVNPDELGVPRQFDPTYASNIVGLADALNPQEQELLPVAPGTTVIDRHTGKPVYQNPRGPHYIPVQPGGKLILDPSSVGNDLPDSAGDDEWEYTPPGGPGPGSGGFL